MPDIYQCSTIEEYLGKKLRQAIINKMKAKYPNKKIDYLELIKINQEVDRIIEDHLDDIAHEILVKHGII